MYVCIGCACMQTCVCMHAWVYEYLTHVCSYMCICTHAYMYFFAITPPPAPLSIEVGRAGFDTPPIFKSFLRLCSYFIPVCSIVKLLSLGTVDDLMHYCKRPKSECNSASGRPRHLGVIVSTILQTCMKLLYNICLHLTVRR